MQDYIKKKTLSDGRVEEKVKKSERMYLEVLCTGWMSGLDMGEEGELFLLPLDNDRPNWKMKSKKYIKWNRSRVFLLCFNTDKYLSWWLKLFILFPLTLGMDPSAEQLLVFLDRPPPETLLFASVLDSDCVLTLAMSALRTVSMNRLPAPEIVPLLPHSEDDADDDAAADFVSSAPRPLGPMSPL